MSFSKVNLIRNLLMFYLISTSGFIILQDNDLLRLFGFILILIIFLLKKYKFEKNMIVLSTVLAILFLIQTFLFEIFPYTTILGVFIRIFTAYFIVIILGEHFIRYYVRIFYLIAIISLIFYVPLNIITGLSDFLINYSSFASFDYGYLQLKYSLLGIYTVYPEMLERNAGPFWEAGVLSGYIIIAIIFNYIKTKRIYEKKMIIFLITLITTGSTTGFIAFCLLVYLYISDKVNSYIMKKALYSFAVLVISVVFLNSDNLYNKINEQITMAENVNIYEETNTQRFLSVLRDIEDIQGYELTGRGPNNATRFKVNNTLDRTNGFTDICVEYGIPFVTYLLFLLYKSFRYIFIYYNFNTMRYPIFVTITIVILLQSEIYFDYSLFWSLIFFPFIPKIRDKVQIINK